MSTPGDLLEALGREARARLGGRGEPRARTYRGRTVEELIPRIQADFGSDAMIIRRREGLTGGVLGFFQHAFVEIEATAGTPAVDLYDEDPAVAPALPPAHPQRSPAPSPTAPLPAMPGAERTDGLGTLTSLSESVGHPSTSAPPAPAPVPGAPAPGGVDLGNAAPAGAALAGPVVPAPGRSLSGSPAARAAYGAEPAAPRLHASPATPGGLGASSYVSPKLAALARAEVLPGVSRPAAGAQGELSLGTILATRTVPASTPAPLEAPLEPSAPMPLAPPAPERRTVAPGSHERARAGVERSLRRYGVSEEMANELIEAAAAHTLPLSPRAGLAEAVRATLAQRIPVAPPLPSAGAALVIVGAGGAGKTACAVALLNAYRRASTLQASYASLMRADPAGELELLMAPRLMKPAPASSTRAVRALNAGRAGGLTIIDTPALSPANRGGVRELSRLLTTVAPERVTIALPATLGGGAAAQLLEALAPLKANALAITHADETDQIGVAIEAACRYGLAPDLSVARGRGASWRLSRLDPGELAARLLA